MNIHIGVFSDYVYGKFGFVDIHIHPLTRQSSRSNEPLVGSANH